MDLIGVGLLSGERVVSGMSLGTKNSMYESFKGAPGSNFVGFTQFPIYTIVQGLQLQTAITFGCS